MKIAATTPHLLVAALALAFAAATIWAHTQGATQPAYAIASHDSSGSPGFSSAFGDGTVVRNLLF